MKARIKKFWKSLGSGLITGASDDDPSAIVSYSVAGARLGPQTLWTMLYILPLMIVIQVMSARIGLASSCGLAGNLKRHYPRMLLFFIATLIIVSNVFNIGANIFGMAAGIELLLPGSATIWSFVLVGFLIWMVIALPYRRIVALFKWFALVLVSYIIAGFIAIDDWPTMLRNLIIPTFSFNKEFFIIILAVLGTTISPYMAFWQASEEAEERRIKNNEQNKKYVCEFRVVTKKEINRTIGDTKIGMIFSNLVGFFVIALTGSVLYNAGVHEINTVQDAAAALKPLAGNYATLLFTLGIVGSGLLAIPILAGSSAYVLSEMFNWKGSLDKPFSKAREFYIVIIIATAVGIIMPFAGIGAVQALFWTAIIHAIVAPFLIATLIHMANNPAIVGPNVNSPKTNALAYLAFIVLALGLLVLAVSETPLLKFSQDAMPALSEKLFMIIGP